MKGNTMVVLGYALLIVWQSHACSSAAAQQDITSSITEFRTEYSRALEQIEAYYSQLTCTSDVGFMERSKPVVALLAFSSNGRSFKAVWHNPGPSSGSLVATAFLRTPEEVIYHLSQFPGSEDWIIERSGLPDSVLCAVRMELFPIFCPYYIGVWRIADLLTNPDFEIVTVTDATDAAGKKRRVEWRCKFRDPDKGHEIIADGAGWFEVRPDDKWVMTDYELGYNPGDTRFFCYRAKINYEFSSKEVPLVTSAEYWREVGLQRAKDNVHTFSNVIMGHRVLPASDFTLAAFGIGKVPTRRLWFAVSVIVLVALGMAGVVFRILAKR